VARLGTPNSYLSSNQELRFGRRGSLAVVIAGMRAGTWFDHENGVGGDLFDLIRRQNGGSFRHAVEYAQHFLDHVQTDQGTSHSSTRRRSRATDRASVSYQRQAVELWNEGRPIAETIAARYLAIRGIAESADIDGEVLRFHPSCPYGEK